MEMQDITLFKLLRIYEKALNRFELEKKKPIHRVVQYPYTIDGQKEQMLNLLSNARDQKISFSEVITFNREKIAVIYNFLAILELLQLNLISIHIGLGYNNFWITQGQNNEIAIEEEV
jgi:segregation and condensation protein A